MLGLSLRRLRRPRAGQAAVRGRTRVRGQGRGGACGGGPSRCARGRRAGGARSGRSGARLSLIRTARAEGQPGDVHLAGAPTRARVGAERRVREGEDLDRMARVVEREGDHRLHPRAPGGDDQGAGRSSCAGAAAGGARCGSTRRRRASTPFSGRRGWSFDAEAKDDVDLCLVLGGDGTILRALRRYAGTEVPVFSINFGAIGFLATVEPKDIEDGIQRALTGEFELLRLPAIVLDGMGAGSGPGSAGAGGDPLAINDVADSPQGRREGCRACLRARRARRSGACAATASWSPRRPAQPATTSPTAGR